MKGSVLKLNLCVTRLRGAPSASDFLNGQTRIELPFRFHRESATGQQGLPRKGIYKSRPLIERIQGVSVPLAFKLDHFQPVKPILFWNFSTSWLSYWGVPISYYPRKWNSPSLDETQGFKCLGRSNWTICSLLSQFCSEIFPTFDFHTG